MFCSGQREDGEHDLDSGDGYIADGEACEELQDIAEADAELESLIRVEPPAELAAGALCGVNSEIDCVGSGVEDDIAGLSYIWGMSHRSS